MPTADYTRWNKRYQDELSDWLPEPRELLKQHRHLLPASGLALDLAMGLGMNAAFLQRAGLNVIGTDISIVALRYARKKTTPPLAVFLADLAEYKFPSRCFDVILNFYFLDHVLLAQFPLIMKPGGIVFMETLTIDMLQVRPDLNPDFLLQKGELADQFTGWEKIYYQEGWVKSDHGKLKSVASLVARKLPE